MDKQDQVVDDVVPKYTRTLTSKEFALLLKVLTVYRNIVNSLLSQTQVPALRGISKDLGELYMKVLTGTSVQLSGEPDDLGDGCPHVGSGGYHSDSYSEPGGECCWCAERSPEHG